MNRELVLTVLYDLALAMGSEVDSQRLLDKMLRRLLYHTGFPAGVVLEKPAVASAPAGVRLSIAHGDYALAQRCGTLIDLPPALLSSKVVLTADAALLLPLALAQPYTHCLALPVGERITVLLLSPREIACGLPLTDIFQPLLANLAKVVGLARQSEDLHVQIAWERDVARAETDRERSFLSALYRTLPDLVWLKDPQGVYLTCNAQFARLCATGPENVVGKTDYDFVSQELADFFREKDLAASAAGKPTANEEKLRFPDTGETGWFHTIKTPMFDKDGAFVGVLGVARDISEQHQLLETLRQKEAALQGQQVQLAQRVFERTKELAQANVHLEQTQFAMDHAGIGIHGWMPAMAVSCSSIKWRPGCWAIALRK